MKYYFLLIILLFSSSVFAQKIDRVEIKGKIVTETNDKEGVTVYNTSSNKGAITNKDGEFIINATLNDIIEVSALQFEKFTVTINDQILKSRKMTVFLIEQVNKLDEVIILPYNLTGNLVTDVESVKTFNPDLDAIYFGVDNISVYEFSDDYKSGVRNTVMSNGVNNVIGADLFQIVGLLVNAIFPSKNKKKNFITDRRKLLPTFSTKDLWDFYSTEFITEAFNIKENNIEAFIAFAENNNLDYSLLKKQREFEFLEAVKKQSDLFLKTKHD